MELVRLTAGNDCRQPIDKMSNIGIGNKLTRIISRVDGADAAERYQVKGEDNKVPRPNTSSSESDDSLPPRKIISWEDEDPENPYNWSIVCVQ